VTCFFISSLSLPFSPISLLVLLFACSFFSFVVPDVSAMPSFHHGICDYFLFGEFFFQ
jgi:hypothetical protein